MSSQLNIPLIRATALWIKVAQPHQLASVDPQVYTFGTLISNTSGVTDLHPHRRSEVPTPQPLE